LRILRLDVCDIQAIHTCADAPKANPANNAAAIPTRKNTVGFILSPDCFLIFFLFKHEFKRYGTPFLYAGRLFSDGIFDPFWCRSLVKNNCSAACNNLQRLLIIT
jgi:hypothetical protein